jgi:hypothetical protein
LKIINKDEKNKSNKRGTVVNGSIQKSLSNNLKLIKHIKEKPVDKSHLPPLPSLARNSCSF